MANWALTEYVIEGPKETLRKIYDAIEHTENTKEGYKGESNILKSLNISYTEIKNEYNESLDLRGGILPDSLCLSLSGETLKFAAEEAWGISDLKDALKASFPDIAIYYYVEESNESIYATNDKEGKFFPSRFYVDTCIKGNYQSEYFAKETSMYEWLSSITNGKVTDGEKVEEFNSDYEDDESYDENFIHIYEIDIIK